MEGTDWGVRSTMMPDAFIYSINLPGIMPDLMCHLWFNKKAIHLATAKHLSCVRVYAMASKFKTEFGKVTV